jgi:hypothetical protein
MTRILSCPLEPVLSISGRMSTNGAQGLASGAKLQTFVVFWVWRCRSATGPTRSNIPALAHEQVALTTELAGIMSARQLCIAQSAQCVRTAVQPVILHACPEGHVTSAPASKTPRSLQET